MKSTNILLKIKWYKNDSFGDRRAITIDYFTDKELKQKVKDILTKFKTLPMDIGEYKGKIPYSVSLLM